MTKCQWSDVGETCNNEATHIVKIEINGAVMSFPSCEDCLEEEVDG